jgi:hypothetical protein
MVPSRNRRRQRDGPPEGYVPPKELAVRSELFETRLAQRRPD